jgi:hypothetical protein
MPSDIPSGSAKPQIPPHASQQVARGQVLRDEKRRTAVVVHLSGTQGEGATERRGPTSPHTPTVHQSEKQGEIAMEKRQLTSHRAPTALPPRGGC